MVHSRASWWLVAAVLTLMIGSSLPVAVPAWPVKAGPMHPKQACTSFCLDNAGHPLFASNYDNEIWEGLLFVNKRGVTKSGFEPSTTGKYAHWTARYGSVTFSLAGFQMAWAGMNEAGLTISTMWLGETDYAAPDERPPLLAPLWIQYQLDTSATVEEVIANDARVRIHGSADHYLVCERSGACTVVEFLEGKTVFHVGDTVPIKALANDPYRESAEAWLAGRLLGTSRFRIAADGVRDFRPTNQPSAVAYAFETLNRASGQAVGGTPTQWSIVFDSANLRVYWHTSRNPQMRFVDFDSLDLTCGSPVEMLDVHAPLFGDVSDRLGHYTFDANLQHTLNFLAKWGHAGPSDLEVEVLERGLQSFACERPAAPYQEEKGRLLSPVVGWAALALLHRYWPALIVLGMGSGVLVVWSRHTRRRRR